MKIPASEPRSPERLRFHYEVEKELALRIRNAGKQERLGLYRTVYDELFLRVLDHPQVTAPKRASHKFKVTSQIQLVRPFLNSETSFLEIGGGDCALSFAVAPLVNSAYGLDVTDRLVPHPAPPNFKLLLSDGSSIPLPSNTVDLCFSFSVVEHIHGDDFIDHLVEVQRVLRPGGVYYCITPNKLVGPHDVSRYFDDVATGFHLKEYSVGDVANLYRRAGFGEIWIDKRWRSHRFRIPVAAMQAVEACLSVLPARIRTRLGTKRAIYWAMEVCIAGRKRA
ncbi:MAG TPA: class I SAM-dependent methyltransferase [Bryobacteraceae bacterium]|nr:class I SAM-dependent methyltransferase [Bryobacteraceae bacterium]